MVPVAPEGTPPAASDLCAVTDTTVSSGWAARVTLTGATSAGQPASGRIALAPELVPSTISVVELSVVEQDPELGSVTLGTPRRQGDVFVFDLTFGPPGRAASRFPRLVLSARLSIDCGGASREFVATTALYRCSDPVKTYEQAWISSGDACGECAVICEMAASPIVPPQQEASEPLSQAIRAQVTRVGQYGSAVLVQAQHDGGANRFEYQWDVSGG